MKSNASILFREWLHTEHEARKEYLRQYSIARVKERWRMSRRSFLTGMGASAFAFPALANTPFTSFGYTVGSETTPLTTPSRIAYDVNVRGFGAVGNAVADDTAAFQNAINAAFAATGGGGSGSGAPEKNTRLIIPPGKYLITSPLYIKNCAGGIVQGWGNGVSQLLWQPTNGAAIPGGGTYPGSGNSFNVAGGHTPCFMTDGCQYMQFNSFGIGVPGSPTSPQEVTGIDIWAGGSNGQSTGNTFRNLNFNSLGHGILADSPNNGSDNGLVEQCQFSSCSFAGIRVASGNALNWNSHGGGASNCGFGGFGSGSAAYSISTGGICVYDSSTTTNFVDFFNTYASAMNVVGGSSESQKVVTSIAAPVTLTGLSIRMGQTSTSDPFEGTSQGLITVVGCWINCNNQNGAGVLANLGSSGSIVFIGGAIGPEASINLGFVGTAGSKVYAQGISFNGTNANRFASFTGSNVNSIGTGVGLFP
jgi:hypothetical protein